MKKERASAMRPFERSLPMQLMRAREAVMARFRPHLHAHGLTDQQWRIVRALHEVDHLDIVELGARCCLHAASLSRILPKLENEGMLLRRPSSQDQRRIIVSLSARGRRLFARLAPESEAIYAEISKQIGGETLESIYAALEGIIRRLSERPVARGPGKIAAARINSAAKRTAPSAKRR